MNSLTLKRTGIIAAEVATLAATNVQFAFATAADCGTLNDITTGGPLAGAKCAQPVASGSVTNLPSLFATIANVLIFLVGAISVIVLIIGGLRYVISGGNPAQVQGAKNTILYAIVGIVVAVAAFALVSFVFKQLGVV